MIRIKLLNSENPSDSQDIQISPEELGSSEYFIGRLLTCQLALSDLRVSRLHAKISRQGNEYYFTDLGSKSGSQIDNQDIEPHKSYALTTGMIIRICTFLLLVEDVSSGSVANTESAEATNFRRFRETQQAATATTATWDRKPTTAARTANATTANPAAMVPNSSAHTLLSAAEPKRWTKGDLTLRCSRIIRETADAWTFCFVQPDSPTLFVYKPGQFATLDLEINGQQVSRSYTISSSPSRPYDLEITIKRVPAPSSQPQLPAGLVSNWFHDHFKVGDQISLSGPAGKFTCVEHPDRKLLLISAGSGITPVMSMSRWIYDTCSGQDTIFLHSARAPDDIIFRSELELMAARQSNFRLAVTVTRLEPGQAWHGFTGRVDADMLKMVAPDLMERLVYICGPNPFVDAVKATLESIGFPMAQYHAESFGGASGPKKQKSAASAQAKPSAAPAPAPVTVPKETTFGLSSILSSLQYNSTQPETQISSNGHFSGPAAPPANAPEPATISSEANGSSPKLVFTKSGKEVACDGEETVLEVAEREGVSIRSGCRMGSCGRCKQLKTAGEVKMEGYDSETLDSSELAAGYILTCIAYPVGRVAVEV